jgi:N-acetylated-alpha-linked acidic dipeptidase
MVKRVGLLAGVCALGLAGAASAQPLAGKALEQAFDAQISPAEQTEWLRTLSSAPNHVSSPHDKANADYMLGLFKSWGWDAHIERFDVLYPTPISTTVELVAPEAVKLGGQEPPVPGDDTSQNPVGALPPYVAFQGDGDVTADVVYVNYGMPEDYEALARRGVDVRGKIAIARYGVGWRGLKPLLAQWHGAAGCIIYSDPHEDGYAVDDVYPKGGMRPAFAVQRGSVMDMPIYPGDPLTPNVGATPKAKRLRREDVATILKIPVLPMSYGDAQKVLAKLGGPTVPTGWQGSLPFTYHTGGDGAVKLHLAVKSDWSLKPIYDVIAVMKGSTYPDQWVVRGNHHDGWVMGASDPLSGNVALMNEAKAIGGLAKQGWRPKRTLVYASWDGEEPALLGSTEWAEAHADELKKKAVLYVNSDSEGRGTLDAGGSHEYQTLIRDVAADVTDPETGATVADRARAKLKVDAADGRARVRFGGLPGQEAQDIKLEALGSGSDYTAYLQHLGLPSLDLGFGGEGQSGGVYHSLYDSFHHFTTFDDPGLKYGATLSKVAGRVVLRVADADLPPARYSDFADTVATYLDEVQKLADTRAKDDATRAALLQTGAYKLASDPLKPVAPPEAKEATPAFDFAPLKDAVAKLKASASALDAALIAKGPSLAPAAQARVSLILRDVDQLLLDDRGLPGRPWFKNLVYAPGRLTGYGAKTLPGVREAIEDRRFADAREYIGRTAAVLAAYAARLDQARGLVEGPRP